MEPQIIIIILLILTIFTLIILRKGKSGGAAERILRVENEHLKISLARHEEKVGLLTDDREKQLTSSRDERQRLNDEIRDLREELARANRSLESSQAYYRAQQEKIEEQKADLGQMHVKLTKDFELIAAKILEDKSVRFTDLNRANLDLLLSPLKQNLKTFEDKVEKVYKAESDERHVLKGEISKLMELNRQISEEAGNLTRALKADSKKQGNWGEVVLDRILEASGLVAGESYKKQGTYTGEDGARLQPDVVILLPDKKHIVVDSKVSLVAYERLVNGETDEERKLHLRDHLASVRSHVAGLGNKNYQDLYGIDSPDFVLLFVPIESSFAVAIQNDLELFEYAWNRKVVIVTPSTLLATLRTIASIWKQEQQTQNALEIATRAGALYDKFVGFVTDMESIGSSIDTAKRHYTNAFSKLSAGDGNLMKRAENLEKLGARVKKKLDKRLLEE
ncbi:DNA recombination protein RmuC [Pedobacter sp. HMF7056]|uniref:DNA recombination protein RmuC n=2 Tax=Hufsiella ginkgonis TaxID=2695274 RepID=A0A7K1XUL1_9SPHI|nr:DNA recombination protein RmuC [Hufsiella ginkgonis]